MIIGIEAERANSRQKTGVEHYAKQLIVYLAKTDQENQYKIYLRTKPQDWLLNLPSNFHIKVLPFPIFWTQLRISWEALTNPVDVLFIPASALPIVHPKKSIVTIHDLAWKYYPESFTWFNRNFLEYSTRFAVKKASGIIAVSESTKKDIVKFYKVAPDKISVIHHGYEESDGAVSANTNLKQILPEKFVLFLSTLQPRKNLKGLIKAFKDLKTDNPELKHKLLVVGKPGWKYNSILQTMRDSKEVVVYLNYVSDKERLEILSHADLLVLPSFYEGFGMQILEAFSAGIPVATSEVSSMPEVAGEAAVYFNPHSIAEIKNAIKLVLMDKSLSDNLVAKGKERLKNFSWEKCAGETLSVLTE